MVMDDKMGQLVNRATMPKDSYILSFKKKSFKMKEVDLNDNDLFDDVICSHLKVTPKC